MPRTFVPKSGTVLAALALAMMVAAAGCGTLEDGLTVNEWKRAPLAQVSDDGKSVGPRVQGIPLLRPGQ